MSTALDLQTLARALGGEVSGRQVVAPGPNHSRADRSLCVRPSSRADGFVVFSHAGDDFAACRDYVRAKLGLPRDGWRDRLQPSSGKVCHSTPPADDEARIARATAIWHAAQDPNGTVVERHLISRGLALDEAVSCGAIRFHPRCPWKDKATGITEFVPAMVCAMRRIADDRLVAVHRTRLAPAGEKLGRMMLGPAAGTAIKLDPDDAVTHGLTIGEGVETVLAARMLGFRPAWAMGMAGGIAKLPVLAGVDALTILAERDETGANQRAAEECGRRWHAAGREVIIVEPRVGNDVNDAIRSAG